MTLKKKEDIPERESYAYGQILFREGKPVLNNELNALQEIQDNLLRKSSSDTPSGWLDFRPPYVSEDLKNAFYTQDPSGAVPEIAVVNGWPVYVTNTGTSLKHVNKIDLSDMELRAGSRVDGVFLEVWRSELSSETEGSRSRPQAVSRTGTLNDIYMHDENLGWAVGEKGIILKTDNGGDDWYSVTPPVSANFRKLDFLDRYTGFAVGDRGVVVKTINGGNSWFTVTIPEKDNLTDIRVINEKRVCVVGDGGVVLISEDGKTFRSAYKSSGVSENLKCLHFHDAFVGWCAGDNGTILMTRDGGNAWDLFRMTDVATGNSLSADISSMVFMDISDGLAVCRGGRIFRTSDSGYSWSEISERIWHDGEYKRISDIYNTPVDFRKVFVKKEYAIKFTISVFESSKAYFKNLSYKVSPAEYVNSLVLEFTGIRDRRNYRTVLNLDQYATADELKDAIAAIESPYKAEDLNLPDDQREKVRVFDPQIDYEPFRPSEFRPSSGSFSSLNPAQISFSVEDKVWIAGDNGIALVSRNSGSKWELMNLGSSSDFKSVYCIDNKAGWYVGTDGTIVKFDPTDPSALEYQDTDLVSNVSGRVYPEGNVLSQAEDYLPDEMIDPQLGIETSGRVQVQYRIRVVTGVNPFVYQEAGLGQSFVHSLGPNSRLEDAGSYKFENTGTETGDNGLWKARCRNTFDGYSWAVPMFFVARRNSSPYSISGNMNGSTYPELNALRPDGLRYEELYRDEVIDVRRRVNTSSYTTMLESNLERLFSNKLHTNIGDRSSSGAQYGRTIFAADQFQGEAEIGSVLNGEVSSKATLVPIVKTLNPEVQITEDELSFGPVSNGLFHNDRAYFSIQIIRDGEETGETVPGVFEGLGTNRVVFRFADEEAYNSGDIQDTEYRLTAHYLDYSGRGLSRVPQEPIAFRYQSISGRSATSRYFNATGLRDKPRLLEKFKGDVQGYEDYVLLSSVKQSESAEDTALYELGARVDPNNSDYKRSARIFKGQQFRGSLIEYHRFMNIEYATDVVRIPKILNGYSVLGVRAIRNIKGSEYALSVDFSLERSVKDREETVGGGYSKENIIVNLDPASTITSGSVLEVVLEVTSDSTVLGGNSLGIGLNPDNTGDSPDSLRTSLACMFNRASRGIEGLYAGVLYKTDVSDDDKNTVVDISIGAQIPSLTGGRILGVSSYISKNGHPQHYVWYKPFTSGKEYYSLVPVESVSGLGSSSVTVTFHENMSVEGGEILVPMLVELASLPNLNESSSAEAFYRYVPYQAVGNLPRELDLEIMKTSDFLYVTNLGTGAGSKKGEPYEIPAEQIPVNDPEISSDNYFSATDSLEFNNFSIDNGFVKMPSIVSQYVGDDITLSSPNNAGDRLGRPFYSECSDHIVAHAEPLDISTPRKVVLPMIGKIKSDITSPFLRGELVLVLFSKTYKARKENSAGYFEDSGIEVAENRYEFADTSISLFRLVGKPIVR